MWRPRPEWSPECDDLRVGHDNWTGADADPELTTSLIEDEILKGFVEELDPVLI